MTALRTALYLALPLVLSGVGHMVVVKANLFARLRRPISERHFGANKTWRGVVFVPLFTIPCVWAVALLEPSVAAQVSVHLRDGSLTLLGFALGVAYVLFELPNSWMKRRLGIAAGELPSKSAALFGLIDQADSAIGCAIVYALLRQVSLFTLLLLVLVGPAIHLVVNVSLFAVGLRKRPF